MTPEIARMLVDAFRKSEVQPSSAGDGDPSDNLSAREMEILNLIEHGLRNKEIATQLDISYFTVRAHLRKIYEKLHVRCRAGAVAKHLQRKT
jgi:DNA-binding NarL/FixJ family response regulator